MRSIKVKLVVYFSVLILLSSATIGFIAISKGGEILTDEVERSLASLAAEGAKVTDSRIETQMKTLEMISLREDIQSMDWEVQQPVLEEQKQKTNFGNIGVVDSDGNVHYSNGVVLKLEEADYIKKHGMGSLLYPIYC